MNFLSHAFRFLENPEFALGTQIPDLMNVVDRKARPRRKLAEKWLKSSAKDHRQLVLGIVQHHIDDQDFHNNTLFHKLNTQLSEFFREQCPDPKGMRSWFSAHIVIEMLLDTAVSNWKPQLRDRLYDVFRNHKPETVGKVVSQIVGKPLPRFEKMYQMFLTERFLYDYDTDEGILMRLNQVVKRVGLEPFQCGGLQCMAHARQVVYDNWKPLLECLSNPPVDWSK